MTDIYGDQVIIPEHQKELILFLEDYKETKALRTMLMLRKFTPSETNQIREYCQKHLGHALKKEVIKKRGTCNYENATA